MNLKNVVVAVLLGCLLGSLASAQELVFSGPQAGEKLPPLPAKGLMGELAGKNFDVLELIQNKPTLLIFVHSVTRPGFGMTRALSKYAESKKKDGLLTVIIFLTDDPTKTEKWAEILPRQMPAGPTYCISPDGLEGPGAYGLNRNVILTVLVAKEGVVTANSALVQPQLQADGPAILRAIVDATGGGKVPAIEDLEDQRTAMPQRMRAGVAGVEYDDAQLVELLRKVINKQASEESVKQGAAEVEAYVEKNEQARQDLARRITTIVNSDKLGNYGTPAAQEVLKRWAKTYGEKKSDDPEKDEPK